ncbi:hypothetical protein RHDE110596_12160 [Prescottella defluvii]|uniref:hypothetical protein n=1 Tax=Prescottella defluvii TaxID=1323361 RepID=UPI0004F2B55B|nr:hypothetical protein [Prescottella defluvii]
MLKNSTTRRSRLRPALGVGVSAAAAAALFVLTPGTAGADVVVPEPDPFGSLGSAFIAPADGIQMLLGQFGTTTGSVRIVVGGQPATGSLGSLGLGSSTGSLGSTSTGSFGSSYGSVTDSPFS